MQYPWSAQLVVADQALHVTGSPGFGGVPDPEVGFSPFRAMPRGEHATAMMLEPAPSAGEAPPTGSEHSSGAREPSPTVRLLPPGPADALRSQRAEWLRRRRLERTLHDGASLRISAIALQLGLVRHRVAQAELGLDAAIDGLQEELHAALQELRDVAGAIYPTLLDEAGLGPALREAGDRSDAVVHLRVPDTRFDPAVEGAAYFAVAGCLAELTGGTVDVRVHAEDDVLVVDVSGVDVGHAGRMLDQIAGLGGTIDVTGGTGVGTITARIACE